PSRGGGELADDDGDLLLGHDLELDLLAAREPRQLLGEEERLEVAARRLGNGGHPERMAEACRIARLETAMMELHRDLGAMAMRGVGDTPQAGYEAIVGEARLVGDDR